MTATTFDNNLKSASGVTINAGPNTAGNSGNGTKPSITLPQAPVVGNLILGAIFANTDPSGSIDTTKWTIVAHGGSSADQYIVVVRRYAQVGDTASLPAFCTANQTFWGAEAVEISGVTGTWATDFDQSDAIYNNLSTTLNTNSVNTGHNNEIVFTFVANYNATSNITGAVNWTFDLQQFNSSNYGAWSIAHKVYPVSGTAVSTSYTVPNAANPSGYISVFLVGASLAVVQQSALTATATAAASIGATRSCSGKTYFEVTLGSSIGTAQFVGLVTKQFPFSTTNLGADSTDSSVGYDSATGTVKINNSTVSTIQTSAANAVVDVAYDPDAQLVWFRTNGGNWNNSGTANPATGAGGISTSVIPGPMYPAWGAAATGNNATATFTSGFTNPAPSGFSSVDTIQVASSGLNGDVASHSASFTQYGAAKKVTPGGPNQVASTQASRASNIKNAWYGGSRLWSPAAAATHAAGNVKEGATNVQGRLVVVLDNKTKLLLGTALTDSSGNYSIPALGRSLVDILAYDPNTFQMIGYDRVTPV